MRPSRLILIGLALAVSAARADALDIFDFCFWTAETPQHVPSSSKPVQATASATCVDPGFPTSSVLLFMVAQLQRQTSSGWVDHGEAVSTSASYNPFQGQRIAAGTVKDTAECTTGTYRLKFVLGNYPGGWSGTRYSGTRHISCGC